MMLFLVLEQRYQAPIDSQILKRKWNGTNPMKAAESCHNHHPITGAPRERTGRNVWEDLGKKL